MQRLLSILMLVIGFWPLLLGQRNLILRDDIRTLRAEIGGQLQALPILQLNGGEIVEFSFDQMSHDYHRFYYRVEHCDFDWEISEGLFVNEFLESSQTDVLVENHTESQNTTTLYTHYRFTFPNREVRPLVSGNYRITIYDDSTEDPVAKVHCCVVEPLVGVTGKVMTNTDIDWNDAHQQIEMQVAAPNLQVRDLRGEIKTVVFQNGRIDNAVWNATPTYLNGTTLIWEHQRQLIFPAGNEYRRFEQLSHRYPGMRVDELRWFEPYYHATLMEDEARRNYLKVDDRNGISVIRNTDNRDNATESDYVFVHFFLKSDEFEEAEVFVDGQWVTGDFTPEYRLEYNAVRRAYEGVIFLKQGYYNYQYLLLPKGNRIGQTGPIEGNYYQTSNDYTILVYHRSPAGRYDRLVGMATLQN